MLLLYIMTQALETSSVLAYVNFPLYSLQIFTNRHFIVSGGGGAASTGVPNGFEIYELTHDGTRFLAKKVGKQDTGPHVIMNSCIVPNAVSCSFAVGEESGCRLYFLEHKFIKKRDLSNTSDPGEKEPNLKAEDGKKVKIQKELTYVCRPKEYFQTDFHEEEPFQRVVKIANSCIATGGMDGVIRLWSHSSLNMLRELRAHTREIDDIDIASCGKVLCSIAKDGRAILWDVPTGQIICDLKSMPQNGTKYAFRRCRFATIDPHGQVTRLFTIQNAVTSKQSEKCSYIQMWNTRTKEVLKQEETKESLSALAVRNDGKFVAVGTMFTGTIYILAAFSLQKIMKIPKAHGMFVTGLEFVPLSYDSKNSLTTGSEAAVISISVDNRICIHNLPYRGDGISTFSVVALMIVAVCIGFYFCDYFGL